MRGAAGQPQPLERPGGQHGGESPSPRQSAPGQRAVRTSPSDGPSPISAQVSGAVCTRNVHRPGAEPAAPHPGNSLAMTLCSCTWPPVPGQDEPADGDIVICFPGDCPPPRKPEDRLIIVARPARPEPLCLEPQGGHARCSSGTQHGSGSPVTPEGRASRASRAASWTRTQPPQHRVQWG